MSEQLSTGGPSLEQRKKFVKQRPCADKRLKGISSVSEKRNVRALSSDGPCLEQRKQLVNNTNGQQL
jgi:hypothetical protein